MTITNQQFELEAVEFQDSLLKAQCLGCGELFSVNSFNMCLEFFPDPNRVWHVEFIHNCPHSPRFSFHFLYKSAKRLSEKLIDNMAIMEDIFPKNQGVNTPPYSTKSRSVYDLFEPTNPYGLRSFFVESPFTKHTTKAFFGSVPSSSSKHKNRRNKDIFKSFILETCSVCTLHNFGFDFFDYIKFILFEDEIMVEYGLFSNKNIPVPIMTKIIDLDSENDFNSSPKIGLDLANQYMLPYFSATRFFCVMADFVIREEKE